LFFNVSGTKVSHNFHPHDIKIPSPPKLQK
jgi:hypothetical protein